MKNTKKLSAMALTGLMGFSLLGSPVMAQTGDANQNVKTDVSYVSNSTNVDPNGDVVLVVPREVQLKQAKLVDESSSIKLMITRQGENFSKFNKDTFSVVVSASSGNQGKLVNNGNAGKYTLTAKEKNNDNPAWSFNAGTGAYEEKPTLITFNNANDQINTQTELARKLKFSIEKGEADKLDKATPGTIFKDTVTFKVKEFTIAPK